MRLRRILKLAVVAAAYIVLTVAFQPISYGDVQFRIAEVLVLLVFFHADYALPLALGCAIANIPSPLGIVDVVFGTIGTITALLGIVLVARHQRRFGHRWLALAVAALFPALANGIFVGIELHLVYDVPFLAAAMSVAVGELAVVGVLGVPVFLVLARNEAFLAVIDPIGRGGSRADR